MTECIFKRGVTCEDVEDDEISGWLIMPATKVVVLVLKYNDNGDGNIKRKNKNLVNEAVLTNALKLCKKNNIVWIEHGAPTTTPLLAKPRLCVMTSARNTVTRTPGRQRSQGQTRSASPAKTSRHRSARTRRDN